MLKTIQVTTHLANSNNQRSSVKSQEQTQDPQINNKVSLWAIAVLDQSGTNNNLNSLQVICLLAQIQGNQIRHNNKLPINLASQ